MTKRRLDGPDTVDAAIRLLAGLQADGWGAREVTYEVDYASVSPKHAKLPVAATVTVRLSPAH